MILTMMTTATTMAVRGVDLVIHILLSELLSQLEVVFIVSTVEMLFIILCFVVAQNHLFWIRGLSSLSVFSRQNLICTFEKKQS